jgi:hypothetical protein
VAPHSRNNSSGFFPGIPAWQAGYSRNRRIVVIIVATVLCALAAIFGVLNFAHAIVIVCVVALIDVLRSQDSGRIPMHWPPPPRQVRGGARSEVAWLAWSTVNHRGEVSDRALMRVRALAQRLLAEHGIAWSGLPGEAMNPGETARQLIGAEAVTVLTTTDRVRPRALQNTVTRLELLRRMK